MKIMPKNYVSIDFPPLTAAQEQEINGLMSMRDEDIITDDIPVCDFSNAVPYYVQNQTISGDSTAQNAQQIENEVCFA